MIGKTLNHYNVISPLGKGGMGEVFVAEDTRLRRRVALKVLPLEVSGNADRLERFEREAHAVASLNHPNIVTIYSIEESEGVHFFTMELVEGRLLSELIPEDGMNLDAFLRIARPLTEALAAAHEKAITHRDLKPGNVIVSDDGHVKLFDFGLAKFVAPADEGNSEMDTEARTQAGVVMGTFPYMAPEQIEGKNVDRCSDVFSLGILFYEMVLGRRPFAGESSPRLISSILRDVPPPITDVRPDLPESLSTLVEHCLKKLPKDRLPDGGAVRDALAELDAAPDEARRSVAPWVAVLPFANRSSDGELDSFVDGLTEDIITGLSKFPYLLVKSATASFHYKGQTVDRRVVAEELSARYVVEGSLRKSGARIRVNVQVFDAVDGTNLWAENLDRELDPSELFETQDELTDGIVATVADTFGVLVRAMGALAEAKPIGELDAVESVHRFFSYAQRLNASEFPDIRKALERAVREEPRLSIAWASLALCYAIEGRYDYDPRPDPFGRALAAAEHAIEIDDANEVAHWALALIRYYRHDLRGFRASVDRAVGLNPRASSMMVDLGLHLCFAGDWERGLALVHKGIALNSRPPGWVYMGPCLEHYRGGDYERALSYARQVNMPGLWVYHAMLAAAAGQLGRAEDIQIVMEEIRTHVPDLAARSRNLFTKFMFNSPQLFEEILDGMRKAGLEIDE